MFTKHDPYARPSTYIAGHVFDPEFPFTGGQGWALFELGLAEQPVDNAEPQNVGRVGVPLDDDRVVLLVSVPDNDLGRRHVLGREWGVVGGRLLTDGPQYNIRRTGLGFFLILHRQQGRRHRPRFGHDLGASRPRDDVGVHNRRPSWKTLKWSIANINRGWDLRPKRPQRPRRPILPHVHLDFGHDVTGSEVGVAADAVPPSRLRRRLGAWPRRDFDGGGLGGRCGGCR